MESLTVKGLSFTYPQCAKATLSNIDFSVGQGARVLLCGVTGSGKSTLLRCLKPEIRPSGNLDGQVLLEETSVSELNPVESASRIGFVLQDPHQQLVYDTVRAELAFGLENIAAPTDTMRRRIAEIANFFGITSWLDQSTTELSGGQKQIVNLASVIIMQPKVLLLDEPIAQLDPIATKEFISLLLRVNEELGITIIIAEHNLEDLLGTMNSVLYLKNGQLGYYGEPRAFVNYLSSKHEPFITALPEATRMALDDDESNINEDYPLNIKEGRWWLYKKCKKGFRPAASDLQASAVNKQDPTPVNQKTTGNCQLATVNSQLQTAAPLLSAQQIWYRYTRDTPYVLRDLSLSIYPGEILGIVGGNASGKSTLLNVISGVNAPQHGTLSITHDTLKRAALPQDPTALFLHDTLLQDIMAYSQHFNFTDTNAKKILTELGLSCYCNSNPFDLSGGEQQKAALAKLLLSGAQLLLLDEPTKGIDAFAKQELIQILKNHAAKRVGIIIVSHDLEFIASATTHCAMLFDGALIAEAPTNEFFHGNLFYTTAYERLTRGIVK